MLELTTAQALRFKDAFTGATLGWMKAEHDPDGAKKVRYKLDFPSEIRIERMSAREWQERTDYTRQRKGVH